jgi:hypothetical protein
MISSIVLLNDFPINSGHIIKPGGELLRRHWPNYEYSLLVIKSTVGTSVVASFVFMIFTNIKLWPTIGFMGTSGRFFTVFD